VTVITPVVGLPLSVPPNPGADAVSVETEPLSVGEALGVTVVEPPVATLVAGYEPSVGGVLAVTLTVKVAVAVLLVLSVTVNVKVELVAVQDAPTLAVTLPAASTLGER